METNVIRRITDCNASVDQYGDGVFVRNRYADWDCSSRSRLQDAKTWACSMPGIVDPNGYCSGVPYVEYAPGYAPQTIPETSISPGGSQTGSPGGSQTGSPGGSQIMILAGLVGLAWLIKGRKV